MGSDQKQVLLNQQDEQRRTHRQARLDLIARERQQVLRDQQAEQRRKDRQAQDAEYYRLREEQRMAAQKAREEKQLLRDQQDEQRRLDRRAQDEAGIQALARYKAKKAQEKEQRRVFAV